MSENNNNEKIYRFDFTIKAPELPKEMYEMFAAAQAKMLGLRGQMERTSDGFKGYFEGKAPDMEKIKSLLKEADKFKAHISDAVFSQLKEIKKFSDDGFKVK